jgi:SET domain
VEEFPWSLLLATQLVSMRTHGIMSEEQWKGLSGMRSNKDEFPPVLAGPLVLKRVLSYVSGCDEFPKDFPIGPLLRTNCFSLTAPSYDNIGTALDLVVANTNHSCEPNAYVIMDGPTISIRTLRPISKGEEIFINYVDVTEPFAMRQVELSTMYFFDCTCTKCKRGLTEKEDKFLRPPTEFEKKAFCLLIPPADHLEKTKNYIGRDEDSKILAIAQYSFRATADMAITDVPTPFERSWNLHNVQKCWSNLDGLWPQHRYPWPRIDNDLLLAALDLEYYYHALVYAAKIYLDIDPVLHPQEHAPLRVVHTWRLVLLLILFGDGSSVSPAPPTRVSLNHGILITGLLNDLVRQVPKSHGADSRFYKMVQSKHTELTAPFGESLNSDYRGKLDAMVAKQMGGALKQLRKVVDDYLQPEPHRFEDSTLRGCYEMLRLEAKIPVGEREHGQEPGFVD